MTDLDLLDTHVLRLGRGVPDRLPAATRSMIENNLYAVSLATLWELINKKDKPRAPVRYPCAW